MNHVFEEWENVPQEPLIKDEKIRKAVRAWADVFIQNHIMFEFDKLNNGFHSIWENTDRRMESIDFPESKKIMLKDGEYYTITELCGEREDE